MYEKVGYARCSTNETKQDLTRQTELLKQAGATVIYQEFQHGDSYEKKELNKMFADAVPGITEIITTEVSRLSRSTKQLCEIIELVKEKRLCLRILGSITVDCRSGSLDPMTEAFLQMAGVFSSLELSMIRARVKSGVDHARQQGKQIGRPRLNADSLPAEFFRHYPLYKAGKIKKGEFARLIGTARTTLDRYLAVVEE